MNNADWREYRRLIALNAVQEGCKMKDVEYVGRRTEQGCVVHRVRGGQAELLPLRLDLWNHSPTGFEWGYGGSGPAQLALALLAHALRDDDQAVELHQAFKWSMVSRLPHNGWRMTYQQLMKWVEEHDQVRADCRERQTNHDGPVDLGVEALE